MPMHSATIVGLLTSSTLLLFQNQQLYSLILFPKYSNYKIIKEL